MAIPDDIEILTMALLALIQSYPYDEVLGGDAAYIMALSKYLKGIGHEVHGLITNASRGRTSPIYKSAYAIEEFDSWNVRGAVRLGKRTFLSPHHSQLFRAVGGLTGSSFFAQSGSAPAVEKWARSEAEWVKSELAELRPTAAILVHEAIHFAPFLRGGVTRFALLGHVPATLHASGDSPGVNPALHPCLDENLRNSPEFKSRLRAALVHADCVGLNSHEDVDYVRTELGVEPAIFVGMGYGNPEMHPQSDEPVVLFVGNATTPNQEALSWFISCIWPDVLDSCPKARLRVVGRAAAKLEDRGEPGIERVGVVNDLTSEYNRAQLVIAPLISGSAGVKIKVAEAMAHGCPIVTTSFGVDPRDPHQLDDGAFVADTAPEFSKAVITLLLDPEMRAGKSEGAKRVFEQQFSYRACYGEMTHWLERIEKPRSFVA